MCGPAQLVTCASVVQGLEVLLLSFSPREVLGPAMAIVAEVSSDFQFLLEREGVTGGFVEKLTGVGINTIPKFAALVDSQAEMRELFKV